MRLMRGALIPWTRLAVLLLLSTVISITGAQAENKDSLRRDNVPFYASADDRQPAGTISRTDIGESLTILDESRRRLKVKTENRGDVWLRAMDVKRSGTVVPPCPEQIAGSGSEGTAVSRGMSRRCE